jgi:cyclopropane-fatty-acyl-phospholipid synthase
MNRSAKVKLFHLLRMPHGCSLHKSRDNIHHHYDIGNDFYRRWLDDQLVYTCAYFPEPALTLEAAQIAKMDHVCRKLRLQPGQTVLEAGSGWGALAMHMARHYGVNVRAFNISHEQIMLARDHARREGLDDRVEFVEDDWRNIRESCDVFVSVGMLEHVGRKNYRRLGAVIDRCLKPNGIGLIHSIGQNYSRPFNSWIERRIFPGAYPPTLREMMDVFEPRDFSILDVENLRLHYAKTLRHWLERFERSSGVVREEFGDRFVRMWRLYLAGSVAAFESGSMQLFQVLFARGSNHQIPRTRDDVYRHDQTSQNANQDCIIRNA